MGSLCPDKAANSVRKYTIITIITVVCCHHTATIRSLFWPVLFQALARWYLTFAMLAKLDVIEGESQETQVYTPQPSRVQKPTSKAKLKRPPPSVVSEVIGFATPNKRRCPGTYDVLTSVGGHPFNFWV